MHVYLHVDHVYMQQINTALHLNFKTFKYFKDSYQDEVNIMFIKGHMLANGRKCQLNVAFTIL